MASKADRKSTNQRRPFSVARVYKRPARPSVISVSAGFATVKDLRTRTDNAVDSSDRRADCLCCRVVVWRCVVCVYCQCRPVLLFCINDQRPTILFCRSTIYICRAAINDIVFQCNDRRSPIYDLHLQGNDQRSTTLLCTATNNDLHLQVNDQRSTIYIKLQVSDSSLGSIVVIIQARRSGRKTWFLIAEFNVNDLRSSSHHRAVEVSSGGAIVAVRREVKSVFQSKSSSTRSLLKTKLDIYTLIDIAEL